MPTCWIRSFNWLVWPVRNEVSWIPMTAKVQKYKHWSLSLCLLIAGIKTLIRFINKSSNEPQKFPFVHGSCWICCIWTCARIGLTSMEVKLLWSVMACVTNPIISWLGRQIWLHLYHYLLGSSVTGHHINSIWSYGSGSSSWETQQCLDHKLGTNSMMDAEICMYQTNFKTNSLLRMTYETKNSRYGVNLNGTAQKSTPLRPEK